MAEESLPSSVATSWHHYPKIDSLSAVGTTGSSDNSQLELSCPMCGVRAGTEGAAFWNRPLIESPSFFVVPSLGSLLEGWLLIVPRCHFLSAAAMPADLVRELEQLKRRVHQALHSAYGTVCFFEHGPAAQKSATGCGVDHAHVHALPVPEAVLKLTEAYLPPGATFSGGTLKGCREAIDSGYDYLYFEGPTVGRQIAVSSGFSSQTFRRAVAQHLGRPGDYDWRANQNLDLVRATIERLTPAFAWQRP
jgi:diadenosine tetraphosphate (Ap4A) HIT family hydrolase